MVIRNYAKDSLQEAARLPLVARKESLTDLLLRTVTGVVETNKPLIVPARQPLERTLLDEFTTPGVGYTPIAPEVPDETGSPEPPEPPPLFWNTRFPEDLGILRNKPHIVAAGGEYLLQTVLEPYPGRRRQVTARACRGAGRQAGALQAPGPGRRVPGRPSPAASTSWPRSTPTSTPTSPVPQPTRPPAAWKPSVNAARFHGKVVLDGNRLRRLMARHGPAGCCDLFGGRLPIRLPRFLCPQCRAGCCDRKVHLAGLSHGRVSMPSMSGWVLRPWGITAKRVRPTVSMPSMSGWVLRPQAEETARPSKRQCFYALDVGLGVATKDDLIKYYLSEGFYALDVGLGVATAPSSGWRSGTFRVSMPSMSGWVLRRPDGGDKFFDALFLCPRCRAGCCDASAVLAPVLARFYALDVGLGVATRTRKSSSRSRRSGFYALDVGLGVATLFAELARARECFYALDVGLVLRHAARRYYLYE